MAEEISESSTEGDNQQISQPPSHQRTHLKCKKCRSIILDIDSKDIVNAHGEQFVEKLPNIESVYCPTLKKNAEIYITEDYLSNRNKTVWLDKEIRAAEWTKGKLKCEKCSQKLGSFNFVNGEKCECFTFVQPSLHFIQSKVDVIVLK